MLLDLASGVSHVLAEGSGTAVWSPEGDRIAFVREEPGGSEIWVMDADGSDQRHIADGFDPHWSPDGTRVAYNGDPVDLDALWVVDADGDHPRRLDPTGGTSASWSPKGTQIAFERTKPGGAIGELAIMDVVSGAASGVVSASQPAWSPNGRWIAAVSSDSAALVLVDTGTGEIRPIARPGEPVAAPAWSPDGTLIAILEAGNVWVVAPGDGTLRRLTDITGTSTIMTGPLSWSPDGRWLAFATMTSEPHTSDIDVVGVDGGATQRLTTVGGAGEPVWRPALP